MFRRPERVQQTPEQFVQRCHDLGLLTWRLDPNGLATDEPNAPALLAKWLSSRPMRRVLAELASDWSAQSEPQVSEPVPGMWVFPFPEVHRRRRIGYFVAVGFEPSIIESGVLEPSCVGGALQISAVKQQLASRATLSPRCADHLGKTLTWMLEDLRWTTKSEQTIDGFTEQLALAYETVSMLCELSADMSVGNDPVRFIRVVGEHAVQTLQYRWTAIVPDPVQGMEPEQFGQADLDPGDLQRLMFKISHDEPDDIAGSTRVYSVDDPNSSLAPQIVAHPIRVGTRELGMMVCGGKLGDDPQVSSYETKSLQSLTGLLGAFLENSRLYEEQGLMFLGMIRSMSGALDAKDRYTRGHSDRVAYLSAEIARELGFEEDQIERIRISGILHDVGKIGIPESVLCKPGKLTDEEFEAIKLHPQIGHDILKGIPNMDDVLPGVLYHHERYDGRGYPHGLAGEDIPYIARIIGVADTFDAMSSNRAYRSKLTREKVLEEIRRCSGAQFDPLVVDAFLRVNLAGYERMARNHAGQEPYGKAA